MVRNPSKDKVAIVGIGSTGFSREDRGRSQASLALEAAVSAIRDAGLGPADIDGVGGIHPSAPYMVSALGLPEVRWYVNQPPPIGFSLVDAVNAIYSGSCDTVLLVHSVYRTAAISRAAAADPLRRRLGFGGFGPPPDDTRIDPENISGAVGYAAWASRYFHDFTAKREYLGYVAVNDRSWAAHNPLAAIREPLTMEGYLSARMVREPLCLLDMDVPVDGADAFVLTTTERARDLPNKPVLVHATTAGIVDRPDEDQIAGLERHGQHVVVKDLRAKSDIWIPDVDVYFPYDGFSFITLSWIENTGWCGRGEAGPFLAENWDARTNTIRLGGRIPVNTHGGALSEGGTQGSGHLREAALQLRGEAGERQVAGASSALLTPGGFFFNAQGVVLRTETA
jgi:acetyl-CoA acetyltransferase